MAAVDDPKTLGRTRLSFANEAEIDEFAATLDKFERGELTAGPVARLPAGARQLRPAPGRRADDPGQDPAGHPRRGPARRPWPTSADTWSRGFGHITTRQNVQFHFVQPHDVEKVDAPHRGGGPHLARGLRQRRPQHHRLPLRRGGRGRGLRRHALRGGDDALPAAPSLQLLAAAQVQDRLRGLRLRGPRPHRHQRPRLPRAHPQTASAGSTWSRAAAPRPSPPRPRAVRVPARGRDLRGRGSGAPRLPPPRRLQAQAAQPDEVPDPRAGLGRLARRVREGAAGVPGRRRRAVLLPAGAPAGGSRAGLAAAGRRRRSRNARRAPRRGGARARHRAGDAAAGASPPCATTCSGRARTCGRSASPGTRR